MTWKNVVQKMTHAYLHRNGILETAVMFLLFPRVGPTIDPTAAVEVDCVNLNHRIRLCFKIAPTFSFPLFFGCTRVQAKEVKLFPSSWIQFF